MAAPLILVPTDRERRVIGPRLAGHGRVELCGFGLVASAARTATLLAEFRPTRVLLVGIAGGLDDQAVIGTAWRFGRVACHGIGAGSGAGFVSAGQMGWLQWPGDPPDPTTAIADELPCGAWSRSDHPQARHLLVSVAAASAGPEEAAVRRTAFSEAMAEDMEGFAVAAACRLKGLTLDVVRGVSNAAGDRDTSRWRVDAALDAAAELAVQVLGASL